MRRNGSTPQSRWQKGNPMAQHDALPPLLRHYLMHAPLPWSAPSVLRLWRDELARGGTANSALARIDRAACATLARETREMWGPDHPSLVAPSLTSR